MPHLGQIIEWITEAGPALTDASQAFATELSLPLRGVAGLDGAGPTVAVFVTDKVTLFRALESSAGLILAPPALAEAPHDIRILPVRDPRLAFALLAERLATRAAGAVDPLAMVHPGASLGADVAVGPGSVVRSGVRIGAGSRIAANVIVEEGVTLGRRVTVQSGAVLGSYGFGYVRRPSGAYLLFPQQGTLTIEDDVEIGANSTIDRGALGETRIGAGTKIDNLVHIGHNCQIGRNVILAAQTGISGSAVVLDGVVLGGQVGIGEHATVGPDVILGGGAGVLSGKKLFGAGQIFWGRPAQPLKRYLRDLARLRRGT